MNESGALDERLRTYVMQSFEGSVNAYKLCAFSMESGIIPPSPEPIAVFIALLPRAIAVFASFDNAPNDM